MPSKMINEGASTSTLSSSTVMSKAEKKENAPWTEKYRPAVFEEIMGKQ